MLIAGFERGINSALIQGMPAYSALSAVSIWCLWSSDLSEEVESLRLLSLIVLLIFGSLGVFKEQNGLDCEIPKAQMRIE